MALTDKLTAIGAAIRAKNGTADLIPLGEMPKAIAGIRTEGTAPDPWEVYAQTRPASWMPMPKEGEIGPDELYLLVHIPRGRESLAAFTVTCTGGFTVAAGRWEDGAFVQQEAKQWEGSCELCLAADDFGGITAEGFAQCLVRITGTEITHFAPALHSQKTTPVFSNWGVVEVAARLPRIKTMALGSTAPERALRRLRYFALYEGMPENVSAMFQNCQGLVAVTALDTAGAAQAAKLFQNCYSLRALPPLDLSQAEDVNSLFYNCRALTCPPRLNTAGAVDMSSMFYGCGSLWTVPDLDTSSVTTMKAMFSNCSRLEEMPDLDTGRVTDMSSLFYSCSGLRGVRAWNTAAAVNMSSMFGACTALPAAPELDTARATSLSGIFSGCASLSRIPPLNTASCTNLANAFNGCTCLEDIALVPEAVWEKPQAISLQNASLSRAGILALLNSLPTISEAKTLTLTGNPGASQLTQEEREIAVGKGWTLAL